MPLNFDKWGQRLTLPTQWNDAVVPTRGGTIAFAGMANLFTPTTLVHAQANIWGGVTSTAMLLPQNSFQALGASLGVASDVTSLLLADGRILFSWQQSSDASGQQPRIRQAVVDGTNAFDVMSTPLGNADAVTAANYGGHATAQLANGTIVEVATGAASNFETDARDVSFKVFSAPSASTSPAPSTTIHAAIVHASHAGSQVDPDVAALSGGGFVAVWTQETAAGADASASSVRARVFGSTGTPDTDELLVNTTTEWQQQNASVVGLPGGGFVVVWQSKSSTDTADIGDWGVRAQVFSASGAKVGNEVQVNTTTFGDQTDPQVLGFDDGSFLVAWFAGQGAVTGRYFASDGAPVAGEFSIGTSARGDATIHLSRTADGRVLVTWDAVSWTEFGSVPTYGTDGQFLDNRPASIYGTTAGDVIYGHVSSVVDVLVGLSGADTMFAMEGNDYLYGGEGNDSLEGGAGVDVLLGDAGNDTLRGGDDQDYLFGGDGSNALYGDGGVDVLISTGSDSRLEGGDGGDYFYVSGATVVALGGDGNDIFVYSAGGLVSGDSGQDYFYMSAANDTIMGGAGVDVMLGGGGNDVYDGGSSVDYAFLGTGSERIVMRATSSVDVVNGFTPGVDKLVLNQTALTSFTQAQAAITDYGSFCIVTIDSGTAVWLIGVSPSQLTEADFVFS